MPVEYDNIWNFVGKKRESTTVEKDGKAWEVRFKDIYPEFNKPFLNQDIKSEYRNHSIRDQLYDYDEKIISLNDNPYYNDALDMDQQLPDFWDSI